MKKIINTPNAPSPVGPYNQSVMVNGLLFVSGQIAIDPSSGNMVLDNIEAEMTQVLQNIGEILKAAQMDYSHVLKASVFVRDMGMYGRINAVYAKFFQEDSAPARELVEVTGLPKDVNVEISVIAAKEG